MVESLHKVLNFFHEIWRRRVLQVAIPYGIGTWLLLQVAELVLDAFEAPAYILQGLLVLLLLGFPVTIVLAWIFDITPGGTVQRTGPMGEESGPGADHETLPAPDDIPAVSLEMGDSERRQISILSCLFEANAGSNGEIDPEYLIETLPGLQAASKKVAERYNGYLLPDSSGNISLAFGYPQAHDDDARRAVAAGLALIDEVKKEQLQEPESRLSEFTTRVGVATGLVVVNVSGTENAQVSIIGQAPRIASWLQEQAPPDSLVIGPQTLKLVADYFDIETHTSLPKTPFGDDVTLYRVESERSTHDSTADEPQLTGRSNEISLLEERWESVLEGDGQFVVVKGEAGIGKSSLVRAFYRQLARDGSVVVLLSQCSPYERHTPLSPIIQLLQGPMLEFSEKESNDDRLQKLRNFLNDLSVDSTVAVPLLSDLLSLDYGEEFRPPAGSAEAQRALMLELILEIITVTASTRPVLMIIEDLHWADPSTLELLELLIDRGPATGLFVLFSARPEFQANWTSRSFVLVRELLPLSRRDARDLVETIPGATDLPATLVDRIIKETDGNPLYIQELTRTILESDTWRTSMESGEQVDITTLEIPPTLHDSLAARVDDLGEAKPLLQLCSVLGRKFSYEMVRAVSGTENETALKQGLAKIVRSELLYQRGLLEGQTYTFKHILIQETAYNSILKSKRRELHGRTANIIELEIPDVARRQPALLAYHYTEAGVPLKAIPYRTEASRKSLARFANEEAIQQSRLGIALLESMPESLQRAGQEIPLQAILGSALLSTKGYASPEVRKVFSGALALCEQIGDAPQLFKVVVGLWMYYAVAAEYDEALELGQRLVRIAETTMDPAQHNQAHYCLAFILYYTGDFLTAKLHLETAIEGEIDDCDYTTQSPGSDDSRVHIRVMLALVNWFLGDAQAGRNLLDEAETISRQQEHPWGIAFGGFMSAWYYQLRVEPEQTLELADRAAKASEENRFRFWLLLSNYLQAWAKNRSPESPSEPLSAEGVAAMKENFEMYRAIGSRVGSTYMFFGLAREYIALGMNDEAIESLEAGREELESTGEDFFEPEYFRLHGKMHLNRYRQNRSDEDLGKATRYFERALAKARRQESKGLELRATICAAEALSLQDNHELALRMLKGIVQRFAVSENYHDCVRARELLRSLEPGATE